MYRLTPWNPPSGGEPRIYVNGHARSGSRLHLRREPDGAISFHSINIDTAPSRLAGDAYGKRRKDVAAIREVLEHFMFGDDTPFDLVLDAAEGRAPMIERASQ